MEGSTNDTAALWATSDIPCGPLATVIQDLLSVIVYFAIATALI